VDPLLDFVADDGDRPLPRAAEPEVAVVEEEVDPVLLRLDRVIQGARAEHLDIGDGELVPPGRAGVLADLAGDREGGLEGQLSEPLPDVRRDGVLGYDRLQHPSAVAEDDEGDLPLGPQVDHPAPDGHRGAGAAGELGDADERCGHGGGGGGRAPGVPPGAPNGRARRTSVGAGCYTTLPSL
jgi:hypothetical protein